MTSITREKSVVNGGVFGTSRIPGPLGKDSGNKFNWRPYAPALNLQILGPGRAPLSDHTVFSTRQNFPHGLTINSVIHDRNNVQIVSSSAGKTEIRRAQDLGLVVVNGRDEDVSRDFIVVCFRRAGTSSPFCKHG